MYTSMNVLKHTTIPVILIKDYLKQQCSSPALHSKQQCYLTVWTDRNLFLQLLELLAQHLLFLLLYINTRYTQRTQLLL